MYSLKYTSLGFQTMLYDISHKGYVPSNAALTTTNATTTTCRLPITRIDITLNKSDDTAFSLSYLFKKCPRGKKDSFMKTRVEIGIIKIDMLGYVK